MARRRSGWFVPMVAVVFTAAGRGIVTLAVARCRQLPSDWTGGTTPEPSGRNRSKARDPSVVPTSASA